MASAGENALGPPAGGGRTALILPGGGARGAYQVGVLRAISEISAGRPNPFPVICGTSAGAINAAVLASHAHEFGTGVDRLERFWSTMHCERVYRTDAWAVLKSAFHWALSLGFGGRLVANPRSLLDNEPLREFLSTKLRLDGIATAIERGALHGLAITASGYTRAAAISFYQAASGVEAWQRARREGQPDLIGVIDARRAPGPGAGGTGAVSLARRDRRLSAGYDIHGHPERGSEPPQAH
jgi:NTE family protein